MWFESEWTPICTLHSSQNSSESIASADLGSSLCDSHYSCKVVIIIGVVGHHLLGAFANGVSCSYSPQPPWRLSTVSYHHYYY